MAWVDLGKRVRSVNAIITNAERRYGKDSKLVQSVYKSIEEAYGVEGKKRFSTPSAGASLRDVGKIDRALERIRMSSFFTKAGRDEMNKKSRETWMREHSDMDVKAFDRFIRAKSELGSLIYGTSEQIIAELNENGRQLTDRQFKAIVNSYAKKMKDGSFRSGDEPEFFEYLYSESKRLQDEKVSKSGKRKIYGT